MPLNEAQIEAIGVLMEGAEPATAAALDRQIATFPEEDLRRLLGHLRRERTDRLLLPPALEAFHHRQLERAFAEWAVSPRGPDLEAAALLIASFGHPLNDAERCSAELDEMAQAAGKWMEGAEGGGERARRLADYLHGELGFEGNRGNYYEPDNSFLNRVLERRTGIPISLSVLYLLLGRRLRLPLRGVGMPGHFIVKCNAPEGPLYLDPFDAGRILTVDDCASIVKGLGYRFEPRFLNATPARLIVDRMFGNLIGIYQRDGDEERSARLARYREMVRRR